MSINFNEIKITKTNNFFVTQKSQKPQNVFYKNLKNPFFCLVALSEPCAKCYALVFKSKLLRQCHNPHHITSFLQALEGKTLLCRKTITLM